ncbi:protein of unknown function [Cetobacterium ceti]|uniref:DUF1963 domain-containing protein n=1 Tax=Cetobacterium ceti TaxID=180163 RepID=A0A1T4R7E1_9FUSO|nr:protein of unknown function [Cetobacterium ceti]
MPLTDFRSKRIIIDLIKEIYEIENKNISNRLLPNIEDIIWKILANKNPNATIGGYANFPQSDYREYGEHKDKTECLFMIDSYLDSSKVMFGDMGIIFGLISKNDSINRNLDNTLID